MHTRILRHLTYVAAITCTLACSGLAHAQRGISARFGAMRAVAGKSLTLRIEIDDAVGAVDAVQFEVRAPGSDQPQKVKATRGNGQWWTGTLPARHVPPVGATLEVKAELLGARGGLLLVVGALEPYIVEVLTPKNAAQQAALFQRARDEEAPAPFAGGIGVDVRAASNARIRALVGSGIFLSPRTELGLAVTVGPSFSEPATLSGGGPLVVGFEASFRMYPAPPARIGLVPFAEAFGAADLRLPGFDPFAGLRVGATWPVGPAISVEAALGGALAVFDAVGDNTKVGFTGGLRMLVRFGEPAHVRGAK